MADIEIGLFTSYSLAGSSEFATGDPHHAAWVASAYLETAINDYSSYSCDCKLETDKHPDPPKERIDASVQDDICNDGDSKSYNTVWNWFVDWWKHKSCKDSHLEVDDIYFLLTDYDGRGLGAGQTAGFGAQRLIDMSASYQEYGYGTDFLHISNVLEEAGHCLINNMSDDDEDGSGHDSGMLEEDGSTGEWCISPIGLKETETKCLGEYKHENNCGICYDKDVWNDGYVMKYSNCTLNHFSV